MRNRTVFGADQHLKKTLAARLMALADSGIRDPQELRSRTLKTLPLGRAHYGPSLLLSWDTRLIDQRIG